MKESRRKRFYLDTNIILDDPSAHLKFGPENEVVIPWAVFVELDSLKKRPDDAGMAAKQFSRSIYKLGEEGNLEKGIKLSNGATLRITHQYRFNEKDPLPAGIELGGRDTEMLRAVLAGTLCDMKKEWEHILVTNDINLSIAANISGVKYEDRLADKVDIGERFYKGYSLLDLDCPQKGDAYQILLYKLLESNNDKTQRHLDLAKMKREMNASRYSDLEKEIEGLAMNKFWVFLDEKNKKLMNAKKPIDTRLIFRYDHRDMALHGLHTFNDEHILGYQALNLEQQLAFELGGHLADKTFQYAIVGEAGTGKTFTWLLLALYNVEKARRRDENPNPEAKVYITKPQQPLAGESYGFLPGEISDKVILDYGGFLANYAKIMRRSGLTPTFDGNLKKAIDDEGGLISIQPIGFTQGYSFEEDDWFVIDEAQNTSLKTMMTLATRGGHFVCMGNIERPDNPLVRPDRNGLVHAVEAVQRAKQIGKPYFLQAALQYREKVRHEAVEYVLDCYKPLPLRPRGPQD